LITLTQAVTALAGFYVGEQYHVPWAEVAVPQKLQAQLFPFVEGALADLRTSSERVNQGTVNFLELLQQLRPFFWRVCYVVLICGSIITHLSSRIRVGYCGDL
jgi:hypothetical protein